MDATPEHGTQVQPTTVITGPTDGHTHQCLAMRAPGTGNTMAHPPTVVDHHTPTAHATPEQPQLLHTHFERAPADMLATVTWRPNTPAEWCIHRETFHTKHPALTYPVLAKHRSTTAEAPAYPAKHRCSRRVPETQAIEWTTYHLTRAHLLQYIHKYLIK